MELTTTRDELLRPLPENILQEEDVCDERDNTSPSEWVQRKLQMSVRDTNFLVSNLHQGRLIRR
jgi:hypothetical protein